MNSINPDTDPATDRLEAIPDGPNYWRIFSAQTQEVFFLNRITRTGQESMYCSCGVSYKSKTPSMHEQCAHMECVEQHIADYWEAKEARRLYLESSLRSYVGGGGTSGKSGDPYTDEEMGLL